MTNAVLIFRSILVYGLCLPLAVFVGYLLATPLDGTTIAVVGGVFLLFSLPLLLRWHHWILIAAWNMAVIVAFVRGSPALWLVMSAVSFGLAVLQRTLNRHMHFMRAPSVGASLIFLAVVILVTAQLTGGAGLRAYGSAMIGGKRYILLLGAILGYFALTSSRIPLARAKFCATLFFATGLTALIGNLIWVINPNFYFIFLIFPPDPSGVMAIISSGHSVGLIRRFAAFSAAAIPMFCLLLANYGIRGLFDFRRWWRPFLLAAVIGMSLFGGFRSIVLMFAFVFLFQFYLEGLLRSRLLPVTILAVVLGGALCAPYVQNLPLSMQRALSFLPVEVDPVARSDAQGSTEWRLEIWKRVLPLVPRYLLLGKGYAINASELAAVSGIRGPEFEMGEGAELVGDYHNGPLSVLIPLGACGAIGFLWFLIASARVLHQNYRYGDPALKRINTFLLAYFLARAAFFVFIFGTFYSELFLFTGLVGLSVSLNGGVAQPQPAVVPQAKPVVVPRPLAPVSA